MPAQGVARDRCVIGSRHDGPGSLRPWCISHDAPAGHAREAGEVGADPADRPSLSDLAVTDAEEQYAGRLPTAPTGDWHNAQAAAAYRTLRDRDASEDDRASARVGLAVLRAQDATAAVAWTNRPTLLPMGAECGTCRGLVMRTAELVDEILRVSPWRHIPDPDAMPYDHPVTRVAFTA